MKKEKKGGKLIIAVGAIAICTVTAGACDLYWNPMLCERLAGRKRILLKKMNR